MAEEPLAAEALCEHAWGYSKPAHASASVRICSFCHTIDGEDLMRTLDEYAQKNAHAKVAEHERQQDEACLAEIEQVLAKYGRKLQITQPQITIVPT
jgi:hypothetical protein